MNIAIKMYLLKDKKLCFILACGIVYLIIAYIREEYGYSLHSLTEKILMQQQLKPDKIQPLRDASFNQLDNYDIYPCFKELDSRTDGSCVRTICPTERCGGRVNCTGLPLIVANNVSICTHDPQHDTIARIIKRTGGWEMGLVSNMIRVLRANPDMVLVDLGCNIGVYTLVAAWMSRRVVCVDANYKNIELVQASLRLSKLTENVTLIWNALSNKRNVATLKIVEGNMGASRLGNITIKSYKSTTSLAVQTIQLDELQPLLRGKQVYMKMDIENYELNALEGGREFLKNIDVRFIQMEFVDATTRLQITELLHGYGLLPFRDIGAKRKIDQADIYELNTMNVYFINKDAYAK